MYYLCKKKNGPKEDKKVKKLFYSVKQMMKVSFAANIMILPIMLYHYNTMSVTFLISNVLASPILGICLIMALILTIFILIFRPLAQIFSYVLIPMIQILMQITTITSKLPLSQILLPTPQIWQIIIYYLLLMFVFYKNKRRETIAAILMCKLHFFKKQFRSNIKKVILVVGIITLLLPYVFSFIPNDYTSIHCIDVGQRR
ncbi:MAG: ComEC/Rec2 family competence protein [Clostridia bacterium]|nr:ComEC/Rec2 family competence protein [Clostridia bacterium]